MIVKGTFILMTSAVVVLGQRPFFAGSRPIGYPVPENITTPDPLGNRFGGENGTTERLPLEALGDRNLVDRISKLPVDKQPFWYLNWKQLEEQRKNPQNYPLRPSPFVENAFSSPILPKPDNDNSNVNMNQNFGVPDPNFGVPNPSFNPNFGAPSSNSNQNFGVPNPSFNPNFGAPSSNSNQNFGVPDPKQTLGVRNVNSNTNFEISNFGSNQNGKKSHSDPVKKFQSPFENNYKPEIDSNTQPTTESNTKKPLPVSPSSTFEIVRNNSGTSFNIIPISGSGNSNSGSPSDLNPRIPVSQSIIDPATLSIKGEDELSKSKVQSLNSKPGTAMSGLGFAPRDVDVSKLPPL